MRRLLMVWAMALGTLGCARIYRPPAVVAPRPEPRGEALAVQVLPQPWGDNSGYAAKARARGLRILAVAVQNTSPEPMVRVEVVAQAPAETLSPPAAAAQVRQPALAYLAYPALPLLASLGAEAGTGGGAVLSDRTAYQLLGLVGLAIGIPNAAVAAHSNRALEAFLRNHALALGDLAPGELRRGLVMVRVPGGSPPPTLEIRYRTRAGEGRVACPCPEAPGP